MSKTIETIIKKYGKPIRITSKIKERLILSESTDVKSFLDTYFKYDQPGTTSSIETVSDVSNRSIPDLYMLVNNYFPCDFDTFFEALDDLHMCTLIHSLYCPDINRVVFYNNAAMRVYKKKETSESIIEYLKNNLDGWEKSETSIDGYYYIGENLTIEQFLKEYEKKPAKRNVARRVRV